MSEIKEIKEIKEITNANFIKEKLNNFIVYCKNVLINKVKSDKQEELFKNLETLKNIEITQFIQHVLMEMSPYKSNTLAYIDKMLEGSQLTKSDLTNEEYIKLGKYISCFITVCS